MSLSIKWTKRFMRHAEEVATWSKDRSTQVGAVVVDDDKTILSSGYNSFPRGIDDDIENRHERPQKYLWTEHAERNAVYNACRTGVSLKGATIFCTMFPCADCARAIIQSGITTIVTKVPNSEVWAEHHKVSREMMDEAGLLIVNYKN